MTKEYVGEKREHFRETILAHYKENGRDLPWRKTRDPYYILVSELMLQQTQVDRVIPKYLAFLQRFPTSTSVVDASQKDVLILWQGLGYNRRALYLQEAAKIFLENASPSYEKILSQKGIGAYTAAAICSFAYNEDIVVMDVNVRRVFSRYFGNITDEEIAKVLPLGQSRDWHNALMDFGSGICTKRNPSCSMCPLNESCHAFTHNTFDTKRAHIQKKFVGSVRWHRGQILKACLQKSQTYVAIWSILDSRYRNKEYFDLAIHQLSEEGFIVKKAQIFMIQEK